VKNKKARLKNYFETSHEIKTRGTTQIALKSAAQALSSLIH